MAVAEDISLRLLIDRVQDHAIFTLDASGYIQSWNPGAVRIKGYTAEEAIGRHFSMLYLDEDADAGIPGRNLTIARTEGIFRDPEGRRKRKNGEIYTAEVEIVPLIDEGRLLGFAKVVREVTERVRIRDQLRDAYRILDQFTAIAAHDLQEPLRMVTSYLSLLDKQAPALDDRLRGFLHQAVDGATRMKHLITNLLSLSHVSRAELQPTEFDPTEAFAEALNNLAVRIHETGGTVTHDPMPRVRADRGLLIQVFQNLIANALKFMRPNTEPRIHASAALDADGKHVVFSIRDNGIGMKAEDLRRVFLAFERVGGGGYAGSGLGLSIWQRAIERHHGRIWVESEFGIGSTFHFTLPVEFGLR